MTDKNQEPRLKVSYRRIFRNLPGLFLILKPDNYEIMAVSDAYLRELKRKRSEIIGKRLFKDYPEDPHEKQLPGLRKLRQSIDRVKTESRTDTMPVTRYPIIIPETGDNHLEERWWSLVNSPVLNTEGDIEFIILRIENVTSVVQQLQTEIKDAERADRDGIEETFSTSDILLRGTELRREKELAVDRLQESERKYRTLFETIDEGFCIMEKVPTSEPDLPDFRILEANPGFEKQSGLEDPKGKTLRDLVPEIEEEILKICDQVMVTGESVRFEDYVSSLDLWVSAFVFRLESAEMPRLGVLFNDITERKQTEEKLRASKDRLSAALEIDTVGVLFWGPDFTITEVNDAFLQMSGFSYEEVIGKRWQELTPKEFHEASEQAVADIQSTGRTPAYEKQYYRKDGSRWWGLFAPRKINEEEAVEYVIDITDRKQREQRDKFLLRLNDTLRSMYDPNKIQKEALRLLREELDANRTLYIEANTSVDEYVIKNDVTNGVPSITGKLSLNDFGKSLVDELEAANTYIATNIPNHPKLDKKEKENYRNIEVQAKIAVPLVKNGQLAIILAVHQATPREWTDLEIALVEETAERMWAYLERARAEEKLVVLKDNLEERVKDRTAALKDYQEQLRSLASQLNKAEEKEQRRLAAELHDNLGQLLTLGKMKIQNLTKNNLPGETADKITDLSKLIDDSLTYTRELMSDLTPPPSIDKENIIENLKWTANKMEKRGLKVAIEVDDQPKPLEEEVRTVLNRSVNELLFNVVKHAEVDKARVVVSRHNNMIQITVEDNGKGFKMEGEKPVPTDEGGFGLFNIRERMNYLGGDLEIISAPNKGTRAILYAPLKRQDNAGIMENKTDSKRPLPNKSAAQNKLCDAIKVLLADDHAMVRRGLREMIEEQDDMTIIAEASDGKEAVEMAHKFSPDVIVMDVNMPVMDGIEATREITSSMPHVRVIGLSLHDQKKVAEDMHNVGAKAYLTKTEAFETLCATIRSEARMT